MADIQISTNVTNSATILKKQLNILTDHLSQVKDPEQTTERLWRDFLGELDYFFHGTRLQEQVAHLVIAIAEMTDTISGVHNLSRTLVSLIRKQLDFYYVGLFLLDEAQQQVELYAASSAGQLHLDNPYTIALDSTNAIAQTVIAQQAVTHTYNGSGAAISYLSPLPPDNIVEIILPLSSRGETLGALVLLDTGQLLSRPEERIDILQALASQVANAIQTTQLFATIDRQLEQMAALYHISLQVGGHLNVDLKLDEDHLNFYSFLDELTHLSLKLANADLSIVRLLGPNEQQPPMVRFASPLFHDLSLAQIESLHTNVDPQVVQTKQGILVNNWKSHHPDPILPKPILAVMNVPIVLRGQVIGTIEVHSYTRKQAFAESDLHILSLLASQAAIAIENAHLFNRAEKNNRFLKTIIEHIPDPIFIKDQNHTWLEMNQANADVVGRPYQELIGKTDHDFFPQSVADEYYRRDNDVFKSNRNLTLEEQTTWADGKDHVVYTRLIPVPSEAEQPEYLLGITHDITERKMREAEKERLLSEMAMLYNGSQAIASAISEKQLFDAFFQQIQTHEPDRILAYYFKIIDDEPIWGELESYWQPTTPATAQAFTPIKRVYLPESAQARLFTLNEPLFIENVSSDQSLTHAERESLLDCHVKAMVILPLATTGQAIGVTFVYFGSPRTFTTTIKRFWRAMADQTSILLANRELIKEVTSRAIQIETAAEVAHTASSILDVQQLLNSTVRLIRDRFDLYYVGAYLVDESKAWAVLRAGTGEAGPLQLQAQYRLKIDKESMIGWCLVNLKARIALDIGKDAVHFQSHYLPNTRSELALPLIHRGMAIGALTVQSEEPAAFSQQDAIFLQTMGDHLANAIENARLFEQAQQEIADRKRAEQETLRRNRELAAVNRVAKAATSTLDFETILQDMVQEMVEIFDVYACGVALLNDVQDGLRVVVDYLRQQDQPNDVGVIIPLKGNPSSQQAVETGKSLVITAAQDHPMTEAVHELLRKRGVQCIMIVPLRVRGRVIGTLGLETIETNREFTPSEVQLAETIAGQIAGAIENAHLFEETQIALVERQRSEEAFRQAEEKYRSIVQNSIDGIFQTTPDGHYISVNPALARIYNYDSPESLMAELTDIEHKLYVDPRRRGEFMRLMDEFGFVSEFESQVYRKDKTVIWISENARTVRDKNGALLYYEGTVTDITERKLAEDALRQALERTQSLYRISDALATLTDQQAMLETVLSEYIHLLGLERGVVVLLDEKQRYNKLEVMYIDGKWVKPDLILPVDEDPIIQHLIKYPIPLVIEDTSAHPITTEYQELLQNVGSMLLIPLLVGNRVVGGIGADAPDNGHIFSQDDIEVGKLIADQLSIWLENRQLLDETQKRSTLLQTAAEVSRAASSILDLNELIDRSVNLIRDKFNFYYVGLFLIEEGWAVLRAGTGEAGRIQLVKGHRLQIGGESMIGWCVKHHQARIALDVGEDAVHFQNPDLPDTHSEMALPLISRDEIIGALTVQSVERGAFSEEDITLLQTMADQIANTIKNAHLFEEVTQAQEESEDRLQETIALQQLSQALSGTLRVSEILDIFLRTCTRVIGFGYVVISQVDEQQHRIKAISGIGVTDSYLKQVNQSLDSDNIMADIVRTGKTEVISGWDDRFDKALYNNRSHTNWVRIFAPITLRQETIGLVEAGFEEMEEKIEETHLRLLRAFIDQTILALDNAQRYEASQRAARREALIKEITTKVRASTDIETILQTTVEEVQQVVKGNQVYINLVTPKNSNITK